MGKPGTCTPWFVELTTEVVDITGPTAIGNVGTPTPRRVEIKLRVSTERPGYIELFDVVLKLIKVEVIELAVVLGERGAFGWGKPGIATERADEVITAGTETFCGNPGGIGNGGTLAPTCVVIDKALVVVTMFWVVVVIPGRAGNPETPTGGADVVTTNALEVLCCGPKMENGGTLPPNCIVVETVPDDDVEIAGCSGTPGTATGGIEPLATHPLEMFCWEPGTGYGGMSVDI